jgi:hypothetical membrane protein
MKNNKNRWLRISGTAGVITPIIAFTCIILAISSYPGFSWRENALSDLGIQSGSTAPLFNYGLIISGLLALTFAVGLFQYIGERSVGKAGATVFILATVALTLIGVFPESSKPMHYYASVAFFFLVPVAMLVIVVASFQVNKPRLAWFALLTALIAAIPWILQFSVNYVPNVAIPETVSAISASVWSTVVGLGIIRTQRSKTEGTVMRRQSV